jgi:hypothetical protein
MTPGTTQVGIYNSRPFDWKSEQYQLLRRFRIRHNVIAQHTISKCNYLGYFYRILDTDGSELLC